MMQYFHLHEHRYLIYLEEKYSWELFRKRVKVAPGSYSEEFAKGLYASVFESANDVTHEYRKYYRDEYEDIFQFMFWRYGVSEEICKQIPNAENKYLAVFEDAWRLEDDDLLKDTFVSIFKELDQ
jgi:hypothetical protein